MIDPTNTAPIALHHPQFGRVLSAGAIVLLVMFAFLLVTDSIPLQEEGVVPPPSNEDAAANSILTPDMQQEFRLLQMQVNSGELSREEADRKIQEFFANVPIPTAE